MSGYRVARMFPVGFNEVARAGDARRGIASTHRGDYETPCFMPVGTRGAIRHLSAQDYEALGARIVLGNTYHLMLRPGAEIVAHLGGLGAFAGWNGLTLTDSGGFQVFSLDPDVDDEGVSFRSIYDGSLHRLTPESAVKTQELLGADIQMALDVCVPLPSPDSVLRLAMSRTADWAKRARATHSRTDQSLFGIVQGGIDPVLRRDSARLAVDLDFDGYGIGGLSVGETRVQMLSALAVTMEHLPRNRPRYLMGVGDPAALIEAVNLGVDQFDCVMQTRLGRHGTALTSTGRLNVTRAEFARSPDPIDAACSCPVCARHTRGYVRHLFQVNEPTASRLVSLHNVAFTLNLMSKIRDAISQGRFDVLRREVLNVWADPAGEKA